MPRYFERKPPRGIENLAPGMLDGGFVTPTAPVVGEAGTDAATH